ncbi:MAG: HAD family phosphatase [Treponema sp.]|jgi:putative hydrolase of the HAD superfamily|nr:HAD family phosphatase [Treponema sp.]
MSIKAVVFDYGGVICFPPPGETCAEMERLTGLSFEALSGLHRKYRSEYDRGIYDTKNYFKFILSTAGITPDDSTLETIAQTETGGYKHINGETVRLMRDIKAAGFMSGILSNMPHDFLAWARKNIPVFNEANPAVFSCEYRLIKPEAAIYEKLREQTGCRFEEIVFFDDIKDNIAAANDLGIHGFIWEGPQAARKQLNEIELLSKLG